MGHINAFPGYEFVYDNEEKKWKNMYRGTDLGFGGYVYAEPGIYHNVALLDVGNMHGASIIALNKFGEHTKRYSEIREARMLIKHGEYDKAKTMFDGKLAKYLQNPEEADQLQQALKLCLNSTYGIAAAGYDNPLRDPRDKNNIIALRGALFMRTLQDELIARGYPGIHYKTDSVKIPGATKEIIDFVIDFGRKYSYEFEHEATYEKMCLVNNAVYIAKYITPEEALQRYNYVPSGIKKHFKKHNHPWTATGTQFQVPYVFKTLFSHEDIEFRDLCEVKTVKTALYLDMDEEIRLSDEEVQELRYLTRMIDTGDPGDKIWKLLSKRYGYESHDCARNRYTQLLEREANSHDYHFVGKVGLFCPMKPGTGGGILLREKDGKYDAATGTKGYRWMESEIVKTLGKEEDIDRSYYRAMVDDAIAAISKYGDFEAFAS